MKDVADVAHRCVERSHVIQVSWDNLYWKMAEVAHLGPGTGKCKDLFTLFDQDLSQPSPKESAGSSQKYRHP